MARRARRIRGSSSGLAVVTHLENQPLRSVVAKLEMNCGIRNWGPRTSLAKRHRREASMYTSVGLEGLDESIEYCASPHPPECQLSIFLQEKARQLTLGELQDVDDKQQWSRGMTLVSHHKPGINVSRLVKGTPSRRTFPNLDQEE